MTFFAVLLLIGACKMQSESKDEVLEQSKGEISYVRHELIKNGFPLADNGRVASFFVSKEDFPGIQKVAGHLQQDLLRVTDVQPELIFDDNISGEYVVVIGSIGKSPLIRQLVEAKKIDISSINEKWESFLIQEVDNPFKGVKKALVIAGSDKRGTIYGMYDLSKEIGVSPWYWWADVPVVKQQKLYVTPGSHWSGEPAVKYRGIFINDEAPALTGWAFEKFGGLNHKFYDKVFELILRMKGNYLWPAMWGKSLFDDDSLSAPLADEYGVVLGTSHHEPLMRAHVEWNRYGSGPWNYETNEDTLRKFWREGIERMNGYESIVTIGMRGDGDEPMTEGTAIALLEKIVSDQRKIIGDVTGKKPEETPQSWALYKEVQDYYDKGMRVPEDVTLLLCDDNWGNIRKLPGINDKPREGGYGMYYHFDYVGGPRNYKWLNTNQIERVWEQMGLANRYGANELWIVNVGDIKPMEFPIQFFLDYAWDPNQLPATSISKYTEKWTRQQFGDEHAKEIAVILEKYTKYNSRRKPELLSPDTYSLINYNEANRVVERYNQLAEEAETIYNKLPENYKDAYYQLVLFPVLACSNLNEMYVATGRNRMYAEQGRAATNDLAVQVQHLFEKDATLTKYFHTELSGGKWNHMMSQTHIGYTYWQEPPENTMPEVKEIILPEKASMGVWAEGSDAWYPEDKDLVLPVFDPYSDQSYGIEIFNRGSDPFEYNAKAKDKWLVVNKGNGKVDKETKIQVKIDWGKAPLGLSESSVVVSASNGDSATIKIRINNPETSKEKIPGFIESDGYIAMEAVHFSKAIDQDSAYWQVIPNLGRTLSAVTPITTSVYQPDGDKGPRLEYKIHTFSSGQVKVRTYLSPTLDFHNTGGLRYAVSFDDQPPMIINMHEESVNGKWDEWMKDNSIIVESKHNLGEAGEHTLKFWMVDPGVVLQKLVIDFGGVRESYLGPPESYNAILEPEKE